MSYSYSCVRCGSKIEKESDVLVNLSRLAFTGGAVTDHPVYVTKEELREIVAAGEAEGGITMRQFLEYAYNDRNEKTLKNNKASDAAKAYKEYEDTYDGAMGRLSDISDSTDETDNTSKSNIPKVDDIEFDDKDDVESVEEEEFNTASTQINNKFKSVRIPGFNQFEVSQLCMNFPGKVCKCNISIQNGMGYRFKLTDTGEEGVAEECYCPQCLHEVCEEAFLYRQLIVGFVGAQEVGKSCLIFSLVNYLRREGGQLCIRNERNLDYFNEQDLYFNRGCTIKKTQALGADVTRNLVNPTVLYHGVLWTFVDIPGDVIQNQRGRVAQDVIVGETEFKAILSCDSYILCTREKDIKNPQKKDAAKATFNTFLELASNTVEDVAEDNKDSFNKRRHFPVMLALTQVDDDPPEVQEFKQKDKVPYLSEYKYRNHYHMLEKMGMLDIINSIAPKTYVTPIVCSAYGMKPKRYEEWEIELNQAYGEYWKELLFNVSYDQVDWTAMRLAADEDMVDAGNQENMGAIEGDTSADQDIEAEKAEDKPAHRKANKIPTELEYDRQREQIEEERRDVGMEPKHLDKIIGWVEKVHAISSNYSVHSDKGKLDKTVIGIESLSRDVTHTDMDTVHVIAQMFCNPSMDDREMIKMDTPRISDKIHLFGFKSWARIKQKLGIKPRKKKSAL